ncbi:nuclear transport factor 2 family protein [Sphingobium sp.]|uniref:nuclear transport factor 2 family protein n=1 Tax=Sphingobium sp. TaxID=1912891 RepID=UPI002C7A09E4|nr:nuclear transport factor 2 family protein [Sphingobium sp.]HUD91489.1 nuclear transport factor 2 family protein [Sphingobium sp.]
MTSDFPAAEPLAVVDALYRYAAGIDLRDHDLLASSLAEDAISDFRPAAAKAGFEYPVLQGRDTLVSALSASLAGIDTTHTVSNPRVWLEGDTARMEALVEAQHVPQDDHSRHYMMKNRYDIDLCRHGDAWVIQRVVVDNVWRIGDPSVLAGV